MSLQSLKPALLLADGYRLVPFELPAICFADIGYFVPQFADALFDKSLHLGMFPRHLYAIDQLLTRHAVRTQGMASRRLALMFCPQLRHSPNAPASIRP